MTGLTSLNHALLLDGRGGARELDWQGVNAWTPQQGCLWVHLDYHDDTAASWVRERSGVNDIACAALLSDQSRPRTITRGDNLLLALRGVNLNPGQQPDDMVAIRIWTDGRRIISTRRRRLLATQDVAQSLREGHGPGNVADLLVALNEALVRRMSDTIESLEDEVMLLEERVLAGDTSGLRYELAQLRKKALGLRRYLAPQREALGRLVAENLSWLDELNSLRLRESTDRLVRHIEDIDEVRERAAMAQEELLSTVSEQMNARTYTLTIVAAIFLPLGFFTGLMGINVGGMPGVESDTAFWVVCVLCALVMAILAVVFRMKKWL